ncbi:hypothetical protein RJ640_030748 [Escallonia rubra]|uniref:RING-type domain-containing protein n=1 Tax=Escallonia rubra TaxID=112253 RepID=A0AA88QSC7_9ASTE|nr:hypothetical protein RJ640_030748 [Escallonia rubra]
MIKNFTVFAGLNRAAALPPDYGGNCVKMKISYSPFAPFVLFLIEWMDYTCTDSLPNYLGLLHILVYKVGLGSLANVYFDGMPTISSEERRATLREFYAVMYPSLKQLEGYLQIELVEDDNRNMKFSNEDLPSDDDCGICMETCPKMVLPDCGHSMCLRCFQDWNARSQSCPFCRGSLKRVTSRDLWDLVSKHDVMNMVSLAKENLRSFYLYIETLPLIIAPDAHLLLYDYLI